MMFAFALSHGAQNAVASFNIAHQIGAAAWAMCEVTVRVPTVHLRGRRLMNSQAPSTIAIAAP
jgi:hypothetical protein